jgi:hypothetical protein
MDIATATPPREEPQVLKVQKSLMALGALGAMALGGSALADAASKGSGSSPSSSASTATPAKPTGPAGGGAPGGHGGQHVGANGKTEELLTGDTAERVKAAALAKVSGGTVERVETDVDHGSPYEAHVRKADGSSVEVLVDADFKVTEVVTQQRP